MGIVHRLVEILHVCVSGEIETDQHGHPTVSSRDPLDYVRHRRFRYRNPEHVHDGLRPFGSTQRQMLVGMQVGDGAGQARRVKRHLFSPG